MGHIVIASPSIARFRLLARLRRELLRLGHRVSVLATDRVGLTFWRHQLDELAAVLPSRHEAPPTPAIEAIGTRHGSVSRAIARMAHHAAELERWFAAEQPDLVLFHQDRTAASALTQNAAEAVGARVLWSGDGLLPGTMQVDDQGLDGDASCRRWAAADFRVVMPDRHLLDASIAHTLAAPTPFELPSPAVVMPPLRERLADATRLCLDGDWHQLSASLHGWRSASLAQPTPTNGDAEGCASDTPFFAVLLQRTDDSSRRLDAELAPEDLRLLRASMAAAARFDRAASIVVIATMHQANRLRRQLGELPRLRYVPMTAAPIWLAAAAAVITINHRLAGVALVCGTPIVHLGRALYDTAGVTTKTTLEDLPQALERATHCDHRALRRRVLTWQLRHGHVWCAADQPNYNGMLGLLQAVERRLERPVAPRSLPYRAGPTWPLAAT